jgi:hypothetical protein
MPLELLAGVPGTSGRLGSGLSGTAVWDSRAHTSRGLCARSEPPPVLARGWPLHRPHSPIVSTDITG